MRKFQFLTIAFLLIASFSFNSTNAQSLWKTNQRAAGVTISLIDFDKIAKNSTSTFLKNKSVVFAYNTMRPILSGLDLNSKYGVSFLGYNGIYKGNTYATDEIGFELQKTAMLSLPVKNFPVSPFLSAGAGLGFYGKKFDTKFFVPVGTGLKVNVNEGRTSIILQSDLRLTNIKKLYHTGIVYSLGFVQSFEKERKVCPPEVAPEIPTYEGQKEAAIKPVEDGDTDNDGVLNSKDKCPTVKGTAKYDGCPMPDRDGDGVADEVDACPDVAGDSKYAGCKPTDKDNDGVFDLDDDCPTVAGTSTNRGCPEEKTTEVTKEMQDKVDYAAKSIYFQTGSAVIKKTSYNALAEIVKILTENEGVSLAIEGHTDNVGTAVRNQTLSERRANAVMNYIAKKGIDAARLSAAGFGENQPIGDNATSAGKTENRRVELKLN